MGGFQVCALGALMGRVQLGRGRKGKGEPMAGGWGCLRPRPASPEELSLVAPVGLLSEVVARVLCVAKAELESHQPRLPCPPPCTPFVVQRKCFLRRRRFWTSWS